MDEIEALYIDKMTNEILTKGKVLCIVEGQDELRFIKKVYELNNQVINCEAFVEKKIELSWGKEPIFWKNKQRCNFQGGNLRGCSVPYPVLESLHANDLEDYKAILVMFDGDCDKFNVKGQSFSLLEAYNHLLFVSKICFERAMLDIIKDDDTNEYIMKHYRIIDESLCKWYKNSYGDIPKQDYFRRVQSLEKVIHMLRLSDIKLESTSLSSCMQFINKSF